GKVGVLRRDPFAMLPFCGYNMGDYMGHWLRMGEGKTMPKIFHVNWFRQGTDGKFLWPGFGENLRVLNWALARAKGRGDAVETPSGYVPAKDAIDVRGLALAGGVMDELTSVDAKGWLAEWPDQSAFYESFGEHLPQEIRRQHEELRKRLSR